MELDEEVAENVQGFQEAEGAVDKMHFHADGTFLIVQCPVIW